MFEILMSNSGPRKIEYPDSGPGPKFAAGDNNIAYFGEVSNTELFSGAELQNQITELKGASVVGDTNPWLKFLYYGRYLFIKKSSLFATGTVPAAISWKGLYEAGLIHGVDGPGLTNAGYPVDQIRLVTKGQFRFKVMSITGEESAMSILPTGYGNDTARHRGMFPELIYRCCTDVVPNYPEAKFEKYPVGTILTGMEVIREVLVNSANPAGLAMYRDASGTPAITGYRLNLALTFAFRWRPVLELVTAKTLFAPKNFSTMAVDTLIGPVANVTFQPAAGANNLVKLTGIIPATTTVTSASKVSADLNQAVVRAQQIFPVGNTNSSQPSAVTATFNP